MKDLNKRIYALSMANPMTILEMYCKNLDESLKKDVMKFYSDNVETSTVILNAMLIFILKYRNGFIPHYSYLASAHKQWLKHVKTPEDALLKLTRPKSDIKPKKSSYKRTQNISEPDWMDDYVKELEKLEH